MSGIIIRTVPNVMQAYDCSAETAQRYCDLRDEGYGMAQAKLMAGLSDPPENECTCKAADMPFGRCCKKPAPAASMANPEQEKAK